MEVLPKKLFVLSLLLPLFAVFVQPSASNIENPTMQMLSDALDWPLPATSSYGEVFEIDPEEEFDGENTAQNKGGDRRSLFWRRTRYYISYGALSANRIPCPPRSGRSYYTHNCFKARGPVNPYYRGCSMITRCRR